MKLTKDRIEWQKGYWQGAPLADKDMAAEMVEICDLALQALAAQSPQVAASPKEGEQWWCKPCRETGMIHCAEVEVCGYMKIVPCEPQVAASELPELEVYDMDGDEAAFIIQAVGWTHLNKVQAKEVIRLVKVGQEAERGKHA